MHWYKFNIADWSLATSHLSAVEEATYFRLINYYYDTEKPIPLETGQVMRRLRIETEQVLSSVLQEFFTRTSKGFVHARCELELAEYRENASSSRSNGRLGGRPRKTKQEPGGLSDETNQHPDSNPSITLTTNQEPSTTNHQPETNKKSAATRERIYTTERSLPDFDPDTGEIVE